MISAKFPHVFYGGDYNPEQWPEEVWREDVRLMQAAGVNLITLAVFSWAKLEPRPGKYDFGWLDRITGLLTEGGIKLDLATATASPPPWLSHQHPESLARDRDLVVYHPGSRQHFCPNSQAYRERASALVRRMAERYGGHPGLLAWHINNEYACRLPGCYCDVCAGAFRAWLRARYGSVDELNARWGTAFWSQAYGDWEEILPPRRTPQSINPAQDLDYRRFQSDSFRGLLEMERAILKEATPTLPVTTNFMAFHEATDYFDWGRHLDFTCWDSYPDPGGTEDGEGEQDAGYWRAWAASGHDLVRGTGGNRPWVLMESTPSAVNWRPLNVAKAPGEMRRWSYQALARGADGVMFFQWRASRAGSEKYHGAMVPHAGEDSRIFREVRQLGAELQKLDAVVGSRVVAKVGLVVDWPSWWAVEQESKPMTFQYVETVQRFHRAFYEANLTTDCTTPEADWLQAGYRVVVAPLCYLATETSAANVARFVDAGGVFVTTFFSGIVDENDRIHLGGYPHPTLRAVLGLRVTEFTPQPLGQTQRLRWHDEPKRKLRGSKWAEVIEPTTAETLASFRDDPNAGQPAITRHRYGRGMAYYLGTELEPEFLGELLRAVCERAEVLPVLDTPAGVEAVVRRGDDNKEFLFLVNGRPRSVTVALKGWKGRRDLLTGKRVERECELGPNGVAVLAP